jgi:hypothetical protein
VRRLLYNSDGTNIFIYRDEVTPGDVFARVDEVADSQVTTFLICPNAGQNMYYPSRLVTMFEAAPDETNRLYRRMSDNLKRLVAEGHDPIGMVVDRAREKGLEAFITFRMNELHDVNTPDSPLLCDFWKSHPEYRVGGHGVWGAEALNYAVPEVRAYFLAALTEVCERFNLDGLELDFMRFPRYLPPGPDEAVEHAAIMTGFVAAVRRMVEARGQARGRPILLSARVPSWLKGCRAIGLDPAEWTRRRLIDFLTVGPFLSTEVDIPVGEFKATCPGIPVYTSIEFGIGGRMMTPQMVRAAAAMLYDAGSDGIYSFNYFCAREVGLEPDFSVFQEIGGPETLAGTDKLYLVPTQAHQVPEVSLPSPMPVRVASGRTRTVLLRTPEPRPPAAVTARVEALEKLTPRDLRLEFNGKLLGEGARPANERLFDRPTPDQPVPLLLCLDFEIPPQLLRHTNEIVMAAERDVTVKWIAVAVRHG